MPFSTISFVLVPMVAKKPMVPWFSRSSSMRCSAANFGLAGKQFTAAAVDLQIDKPGGKIGAVKVFLFSIRRDGCIVNNSFDFAASIKTALPSAMVAARYEFKIMKCCYHSVQI
jgi:hypothetical protein